MTLTRETIEQYDLGYVRGPLLEREGDIEIYSEVRGNPSGPTLTIVNNMFIVAPLWRNFTERLVQDHRILSYDLRNQGASSPADGFTFDDHVEDLRALLDFHGVDRTYLLGTSVSTLICRDFAARYPERVAGLLLFGPVFNPFGGRRRKYLVRSWLFSLESGGVRGLFNHIYPLVFSDTTIEHGGSAAYLAFRQRFLALNSAEQIGANLHASLSVDDDPARLRKIQASTLLAAGEGDFFNCAGSLEGVAREIPSASVSTIPFAGHVPYFEATEVFETIVAEFVAKTHRAGGASGPGR